VADASCPGGGFNHNWLPTGDLSYSLAPKWQLAMEFSGATRANPTTPAITQNLWAVSCTLKPRLVLDSAVQYSRDGQRSPRRLPGRLHVLHR